MSYTGSSGKPPPKKTKKRVAEGTVATLKGQLDAVIKGDSAARKVRKAVIPTEDQTESAEVPSWEDNFAVYGMCLHTCSLEYYGSELVRIGLVH